MKFRFTLLLLCLSLMTLAQNQSIDDIFDGRREIYFRFSVQSASSADFTGQTIAIDKRENGYVYAYASKAQFEDFLTLGVAYEKLTAPSMLLPESEMNMRDNISLNSKTTWNFYPTYSAYVTLMQTFASTYPAICKLDTIGTSVEGRLLLVVKISDNVNSEENEPEFLYTSTMHGDECTGYVTMLHLIDYLLVNYGSITRVTNLVNNMEIYINPLANPDGTYAGGDASVNGATRSNSNGEDLNRNYPVPDGSAGDDGTYTQQVETQAFVAFIEDRNFVVAANIHGGIELMNYPWDFTSDDHADKTWWMYVCKEYADTAQANSTGGYFNAEPSMYVGSPDYPGVVEGYSWYPAPGSRQDYSQYFAQCREVTLEISDTKSPSASTLESFWNYNYKSLFNYMEQAQYGIRGIVTDNCTGLPVRALITITSHDADSSQVYSAPEVGNYHRPIAPGTWSMSVSAPGYQTATATGVTTTNKNTVIRNFALVPTAPTASFVADVTSTCSGTVQFDNQGTYPQGCSFLWTFGDGNTSTLEQPSHTYATNGTFTVKLKITSCSGADSLTRSSYITVNMPTAPTTSGDEICGNGTVDLTASGSGTINWYDALTNGNLVGTGSPWTTPALSATTTYYAGSDITTVGAAQNVGMTNNSSGGQYFTNTSAYRYMIFDVYQDIRLESVKVYVSSAGIRNILLQNSAGTTINSLAVNIPSGSNPYLVTLNFDIPAGTDYRLGIETGSTNNLYLANSPSYPYTIPGVISITGNNQNQSYFYFFFDWIVKTSSQCNSPRTAAVATVNPAPVPSFTATPAGNTVDFQNTSTNGVSYYWTFGDGGSSTQQNPTHVYSSAGSFTVKLVVTGDGSCIDSISQTVTLGQAPSAAFEANIACIGTATNFTDQSNPAFGTMIGWDWNFGDGSGTSTQQHPNYTYSDTGMYVVTLISENSSGLTDTISNSVYVATRPLAEFSFTSGFVGDPSSFTDETQTVYIPLTSWDWRFGDATTSTLQNPDHVYNSEGNFGVILIVSNGCGSDTAVHQISIIISGLADHSTTTSLYPNPAGNSNITLSFDATSEELYVLHLFSSDGSLVYSSEWQSQSGINKVEIDISQLARGAYWLELSNTTNVQRIPFIK